MSILVKDLIDFIIIMVMLLFNAVLGFWHERQAASALDALKGALAQEAQALRGGKWLTVLAKTLVPGDIVRIRLGNVVPADVKLLERPGVSRTQMGHREVGAAARPHRRDDGGRCQ
jgi:H+-transporting ATPase